MIWIGIIFVLLLAADYSLLCKKDISFTLPVSGFTIVFLAYILSWTKLFPYFRDIINIIILLVTMVTGIVFFKSNDKKQRLKTILSPGFAGYLILCLIAYRAGNALFCQWDEFSHWGTVVKDMFYSKQLGIYPDSVSTYKTYPPGAALWELYFTSYFNEWHDWPVNFAYNLLLVQWMMPLFGCLKFGKEERNKRFPIGKTILVTISFVIVVYLVPYLFYSPFEGIPWRCVYIDRALAIGFAWLLFMHFCTVPEKKDDFYYFSFALGAGFQCLLKGTGVFFVLMALLMILSDVILTFGKERKNILIRYGTAFIFPLLAIFSWYAGLRIMNVSQVWDVNAINMESIIKLVSGREEPWRYDIIRNYPEFLKRIVLQYFHGSIILTVTAYPLIWTAGLALISALNGRKDPKINKRNLLIAFAGLLAFVLYELGIMLVELYLLMPEEGLQLSSGQRYTAGFPLGMSCFILFYMINYLFSGSKSGRRNAVYYLLVLLFLFNSVSMEKAVRNLTNVEQEAAESYAYTNFARYKGIEEKIGDILGSENSCYILSENDPYGHFVLRKQFIPVKTNSVTIDSETENRCEAFVKVILFNGYDHVFVNKVSDDFSETCNGIFENRTVSELSLYRVSYQEGFELKLEASF